MLQILDFNIQRLDPAIDDRRGLEIVIVGSLWAFLDAGASAQSSKPSTPSGGKVSPAAVPEAKMAALDLDPGPVRARARRHD